MLFLVILYNCWPNNNKMITLAASALKQIMQYDKNNRLLSTLELFLFIAIYPAFMSLDVLIKFLLIKKTRLGS